MSDKESFTPGNDDPAKQHFIDGVLAEFARNRGDADDRFLDGMEKALDQVDQENGSRKPEIVEFPVAGRKKRIWIGSAIAASLALLLVCGAIWNSRQQEVRSSADYLVVSSDSSSGDPLLVEKKATEALVLTERPASTDLLSSEESRIHPTGHGGRIPAGKADSAPAEEPAPVIRESLRTRERELAAVETSPANAPFPAPGAAPETVPAPSDPAMKEPDATLRFGRGVSRLDSVSDFVETTAPADYGDLPDAPVKERLITGDEIRLKDIEAKNVGDRTAGPDADTIKRQTGLSDTRLAKHPGHPGSAIPLHVTIPAAEGENGGTVNLTSNFGFQFKSGSTGGIVSGNGQPQPTPTTTRGGSVRADEMALANRDSTISLHSSVAPQKIRAVVNGEPITQEALEQSTRTKVQWLLLENAGKLTASDAEQHIRTLERNALDDLIERKLVLGEFDKMGGKIQPQFIDQSVERIVTDQFGGDRQKFLDQLSRQNTTLAEFRDYQRDEIALQALRAQHSRVEDTEIGKRDVGYEAFLVNLRKKAKIVVDPARPKPSPSRERYDELIDNPFASPLEEPLSTFSIDVDTASYTNIRRMIRGGYEIPENAVRIEEMINYFSYDYPQPEGEHPFAFAVETAECPWNEDHQLMRVGIQGKDILREERPPANLVFLLDVSGSMTPQNKLPLVKKCMSLLVEELTGDDTISIVVYAGAEGLCLPPTPGNQGQKILQTLECLRSGGSTNGGAGIQLAYKIARENFKKDGINRVILCTDGDFNVGRTDQGGLVKMVENKARDGVFLSVMGFGTGNINDSMLEAITNKGNGNYFYIDSLDEGRKVLLQDLMGTLVTIAKDVKIQIEFNPGHVQSYRLIGYANRMLEAEDFDNDRVDAGEVGAGHAVTALYEIVPVGAPPVIRQMTELKYQRPVEPEPKKMKLVESDELATVKLRYKRPDGDRSTLMEQPVVYRSREWREASDDYQFSAAVGLWGMLLRNGDYSGRGTAKDVLEMAKEGTGADPFGRRAEFIELVTRWNTRE